MGDGRTASAQAVVSEGKTGEVYIGSTTNNRNKRIAAKGSPLNGSQDNWIAGHIPHSGGFAPVPPLSSIGGFAPNPPNVNTPQNPQNPQITIKVLFAIKCPAIH